MERAGLSIFAALFSSFTLLVFKSELKRHSDRSTRITTLQRERKGSETEANLIRFSLNDNGFPADLKLIAT